MNWWESLNNFIYAIMVAVVGAFVVLIRKILTNEKEIALLKAEITSREESRKERDSNLAVQLNNHNANIDMQLAEIRDDIKHILGKR